MWLRWTSFLVNKVSQTQQKKDGRQNEQASQMQTMQYIFPFMTGYFCYILPSAMGLYWIMGNILQIVQTYALRLFKKNSAEDALVVEPENRTGNNKKKKKK